LCAELKKNVTRTVQGQVSCVLNFKQIVTKTVQVLCHCVGRQINLAYEIRKIKLPVSFTLAQKAHKKRITTEL
jgi:hypothetical protein